MKELLFLLYNEVSKGNFFQMVNEIFLRNLCFCLKYRLTFFVHVYFVIVDVMRLK